MAGQPAALGRVSVRRAALVRDRVYLLPPGGAEHAGVGLLAISRGREYWVAHAGAGVAYGTAPSAHKILVAGGFGAGKTTLVASVSEVGSLTTDVPFSGAGARKDNLEGLPDKTATTVALDFGRITVGDGEVLYLFGVPGQDRFWFMWDELARGALGAVVLADVRRLADCFPSLNYFEQRRVPFLVAVNHFDDAPRYPLAAIREALDLSADVPLVACDARDHDSVKETLICLVENMADSLAPSPGRS